MKYILIALVLMSSSVQAEPTWTSDIVERDGVAYEKFTEAPFTGKVKGRFQGSYKNGKKEGNWVSYHDNGQLRSKGSFKNGKKEGKWIRYWSNGQLRSKKTYKSGELIEQSKWWGDDVILK